MLCKDEFFNGIPADQMFLDDAFHDIRSDGVIPGSIRIHDSDRTLLADSQAVGLGPVHTVLTFVEIQFFDPALQVIPGFETDFPRRALRFCGIGTQKNVAADFSDSQFIRNFRKALLDIVAHYRYFDLRVWSATL